MSESLAQNIPRLAALAAQALHWRPSDFWLATPPELALSLADPGMAQGETLARADLDRMIAHDTRAGKKTENDCNG